ncbi:DNA repair protein RAD51 4 isoform X1 [Carex littledalei]|uniref:DNA repair protein RAD51 4 isoform X1 n=1 Tax=Carex littledalei TaxID=544730 RepID=A0A833QXL6_9POAL|nr:DNA repair protein RAD51 4 isoform X1 [Carex littledalei]
MAAKAPLEEEDTKPQTLLLTGILSNTYRACINTAAPSTAQNPHVTEDFRLPWLTGMELLSDTNQNKHFLPTGLQGIDALLGGGLREGQMTEIVGPSSSGKTQVCLSSATYVVDKKFGAVLYLDTSNSFSPNRISRFVNQTHPSLPKEEKERRLQMIMSNIYCQSVFDIFSLLDLLHHVESTLKHTVKLGGSKLCLLIIDSVSSLIAPIIGGKNSQGWCMMASVGVLLKKIAYEHNISVLVTNHMVGGENGTLKPALGESWKCIPHVRLLLSCCIGANHSTATVLKHTLLASGRTANFVIHN